MKRVLNLVKLMVMVITIISIVFSTNVEVDAGWCLFGHSYGDNIYYHEYESYNNDMHTKVLKGYRICENCGKRAEINASGRIQEAHVDKDSNHICDICNFECGKLYDSEGNHLNHIASVLREKPVEYQKINSSQHYKITYTDEGLCSCGKLMVEGRETKIIQDHIYSNQYDTSCNQCGAHRHIESSCGIVSSSEITEVTGTTHTVKTSDGGGYCSCGEKVRDEKFSLKTVDHVYKDGKCVCGHEEVDLAAAKVHIISEHEHSFDSEYDTDCDCGEHRHLPLMTPPAGEYHYEKYDEEHHYKIRTDGGSMCSCGEILDDPIEVKVLEVHDYSSGVCVNCGEEELNHVEEHNCNQDGHRYDNVIEQYSYSEYYDESFHKVYLHTVIECYCGEKMVTDENLLQGHNLKKGTCTECNAHVHEVAYEWPYEDWKVLEKIDWESHKVFRRDGQYCYCGELIGLGDIYTEEEDHSFINGVCACGYEKSEDDNFIGHLKVIGTEAVETVAEKVVESYEFATGGVMYVGSVVIDGERYVQIMELGGIIGEEMVENGWLVDKEGLDLTSDLISDVSKDVIINMADAYDDFREEDFECWNSGDINRVFAHYSNTFTSILYEAGELDLGLKALDANKFLKLAKSNKVLKHLDDVGDITKLSRSKIDEIVEAVAKKEIPFDDILDFRKKMSNVDFDDDIIKYFDDSIKSADLSDILSVDSDIRKMIDDAEGLMDADHYTKVDGLTTLKADIEYNIGDYLYKTDSQGRIESVHGKLTLNIAPRNNYAQRVAGRASREADDHGGHLIASMFDGSGDLDNLVPMNGKLNQGAWYKMESEWASALADGKVVEVYIVNCYEKASLRPTDFVVGYKIDGKQFYEVFNNSAGG